MLDSLLQKDKELLIYLNNLGNEQWDTMWLAITNQFNWIPLFVIILVLIFKNFGWKRTLFIMLFMTFLITFSDQFTNLIKNYFERLRPNNDISINYLLRHHTNPQSFSFYSGHASVSTTFTVFIILLFRKYYKFIYALILFPMIFGYSRLYLGVHYPLDILAGILAGIFFGSILFKLYAYLDKRLFK